MSAEEDSWLEPSQQVDDITDDEGLLESLCKYLRDLHKSNDFKFKAMIVDIFGAEKLSNYSFQYYLAGKLDINYSNFKQSMKLW